MFSLPEFIVFVAVRQRVDIAVFTVAVSDARMNDASFSGGLCELIIIILWQALLMVEPDACVTT